MVHEICGIIRCTINIKIHKIFPNGMNQLKKLNPNLVKSKIKQNKLKIILRLIHLLILTYLPTLAYLPTYLHRPTYLPTYLFKPIYLPTHLSYLLTYLGLPILGFLTYLPILF
jgi:hypothetical protein